MNHDDPHERTQRRRVIALAFVGAAFTLTLLVARIAPPRLRELATRTAPMPARPWPVIDPAIEPSAEDLPVRGFAERGSLRIETSQTLEDPVLVLVSSDFGAPRLADYRPDYRSDGLLEFYGQTAGVRHGFLRSRELVSELFEVDVERGRIAVVRAGQLLPARTRSLELRRDGRLMTDTKATVLLQYGAFEVVREWLGEPIELATPLAGPQSVTVAPARRGDGALELGSSRSVGSDGEPIVIELEHGGASVALATESASDGDSGSLDSDEFRFTLTPDTDIVAGRPLEVSHLLACVREDEFSLPPHIHTWSSAAEGERAPVIRGLGAGRFRVAAGIERQGRYTLWRSREVRDDESLELHVAALVPRAQPSLGAALLPKWIRSFPTPEGDRTALTGARERSLHPHGPSEVWEETTGEQFTLRRRVGWLSGTGEMLPLREHDLALALPEEATSRVRDVRLRVRPGLEPRLGAAWEYQASSAAGFAGTLAHVPDGQLSGVLVRDDGETWTCGGNVEGGNWESGAPRWSRSGEHVDAVVEALAAKNELAPVAASFTKSGEVDLWTWERLNGALGLDVQALDLATLGLVGQPSGEILHVAHDAMPLSLPRGDLVEAVAQDPGRSLWGFFPARTAAGPGPQPNARIAILDRAGRRTLHVTLPRAELRFDLQPGEMRELVVAAPVEVFLLSIVGTAREQEKAAEEGLGVELRAGDVLVAEYD